MEEYEEYFKYHYEYDPAIMKEFQSDFSEEMIPRIYMTDNILETIDLMDNNTAILMKINIKQNEKRKHDKIKQEIIYAEEARTRRRDNKIQEIIKILLVNPFKSCEKDSVCQNQTKI